MKSETMKQHSSMGVRKGKGLKIVSLVRKVRTTHSRAALGCRVGAGGAIYEAEAYWQ